MATSCQGEITGLRPIPLVLQGKLLTALEAERARRHERFGEVLPAALSRAQPAACHAELGMLADGRAFGEEGLRIAEAVDHPRSLLWAYWGLGRIYLRQGDLPRALPLLEGARGICQGAGLLASLPWMAAAFGEAYTLCGRIEEAHASSSTAIELYRAMEMTFWLPQAEAALATR